MGVELGGDFIVKLFWVFLLFPKYHDALKYWGLNFRTYITGREQMTFQAVEILIIYC